MKTITLRVGSNTLRGLVLVTGLAGIFILGVSLGFWIKNPTNSAWLSMLALLTAITGAFSTGYSVGSYREHMKVLRQYRLIGEDTHQTLPPWCTKCWVHCNVRTDSVVHLDELDKIKGPTH